MTVTIKALSDLTTDELIIRLQAVCRRAVDDSASVEAECSVCAADRDDARAERDDTEAVIVEAIRRLKNSELTNDLLHNDLADQSGP